MALHCCRCYWLSLHVGPDDFDQFLTAVPACGIALSGQHVLAQVILHHLCRQPVHGAAHGGKLAQDFGTGGAGLQCFFDSFDLASDAAYARNQLLLMPDSVGNGCWLPSLDNGMGDYSILAAAGEVVALREEHIEWEADGRSVAVGLTRFGSGPSLLLLPALSSISTRSEMRPLQERLGTQFSTVAID